jgi:hypothetical protein
MAADQYTEVSTQSWFSRIGNSIKGILFGILLIVAAFPVLFLNEGRAVKRYKTLKEGGSNVIAVTADKIDPALQSKLIHIAGIAKTKDVIKDDIFSVSTNAIALIREVQMYQWKETKTKKEEKQLGGSTKTTTVYDYKKVWSDEPIDTRDFKKPEGHQNPGKFPFESNKQYASDVKLGAFELGDNVLRSITGATVLPVDNNKLPVINNKKAAVLGNDYFIGQQPSDPQIGDIKVSFKIIKPEVAVSVVGKQADKTIESYKTDVGGNILLVEMGQVSAEDMFKNAQAANSRLTWLLRGLGFILMVVGFATLFKPLSVLADVIPFIGNIVEGGTLLISILIAAMLSTITIAIGWIAFRPLLGIGILVVAGIIGFVTFTRIKAGKAKRKAKIEAMDLSMPV